MTLRLTSLARYVSGARAPDMGNRRRKMNIDQRMRELYSTDNVFSTGFSADSRLYLIIPGSQSILESIRVAALIDNADFPHA